MAWHGITHAVPLGQRVLAQHLLSHEEGQSPVKFSVSTRQLFRVVSTPWNMKYDCNRHKKMRNCAFFSRPELLSLRSLRLLLSNLELVDLQMLLSLQELAFQDTAAEWRDIFSPKLVWQQLWSVILTYSHYGSKPASLVKNVENLVACPYAALCALELFLKGQKHINIKNL